MRLAGSRAACELLTDEGTADEIAHQGFVDARPVEVEVVDVLRQGKLGDRHLIFDRAGVLFGDFSLEKVAHDLRRLMLPLDARSITSS
jgi:hypothetical protein